jgi:hypothetical protein
MTSTRAPSVKDYLETLPAERRRVIAKVRGLVRKHLPKGYRETLSWGSITYEIPLTRYPDTYNQRPLCYIGLAAQKNHYALYLMCAYMDPDVLEMLKTGFKKAGKKLDMGKSCLRFKKLEDLPLDTIGKVVGSVTPAAYIKLYESAKS